MRGEPLKVGDRVSFSRVFCERIGLTGKDVEQRGTVVSHLREVPPAVYVQWDHGTVSASIEVNLRRVA